MLRHAFHGLTVMFSGAAVTQTAPPAPAPPYGSNITLVQAKAVLAAAEAQAAKLNGTGAVFAIVQPNGALVLFEKFDDSTYLSSNSHKRRRARRRLRGARLAGGRRAHRHSRTLLDYRAECPS